MYSKILLACDISDIIRLFLHSRVSPFLGKVIIIDFVQSSGVLGVPNFVAGLPDAWNGWRPNTLRLTAKSGQPNKIYKKATFWHNHVIRVSFGRAKLVSANF